MKKTLLSVLIALGLLGLADSIYLSYAEITDSKLACSISGLSGCNIVAQSEYSHILGIPLGVYGIGFYTFVLVLAIVASVFPCRKTYLAQLLVGWFGLLASIVFVLIQVFLIQALCIYCLGSAVIAFLICILVSQLWRMAPPVKQKTVSIPGM